MEKLLLLYLGCVFLMYLSQLYYPVKYHLQGRQGSRANLWLEKSDIFMAVAIFWISAFSFLRTSYNDTEAYIHMFRQSESVAEGFASGEFTDWLANPFSMLYRSLIHDLTDNYHIYFFFPAFLNTVAFIKLFKRYSLYPAFSTMLFFALGTYVTYLASLKQSFAMAFLLFSVPYALDKKYVKFFVLVLLGALFHNYAIGFAVVPLLMNRPWGKTTWIMAGITLFAMATYDQTLGAVVEQAEILGAEMHEDEIFYESQLNILRVLVYWVPPLIALLFNGRLFRDSSRVERFFTNISILCAMILSLGLVKGANLMARMAAYFEFGACISLPWMIKKIFTKDSARLVTVLAGILYLGYFYYEFAINKDFGAKYSAITLWQFIRSLFA